MADDSPRSRTNRVRHVVAHRFENPTVSQPMAFQQPVPLSPSSPPLVLKVVPHKVLPSTFVVSPVYAVMNDWPDVPWVYALPDMPRTSVVPPVPSLLAVDALLNDWPNVP